MACKKNAIFKFHKELDVVAIGSLLGRTLVNSLLCYLEKRWLDKCPPKLKPVFYRQNVNDTFVLFKKEELKLFQITLNCATKISNLLKKKGNKKLYFLDISRDEPNKILS